MKVETTLNDYRILVVDDNPTNLGVIVDFLEEHGFEILVALDGEDGLETAQEAQPDLILLDVMMPGIDGFETCRRLKAEADTHEIPVIFMTALTSTEDKVRGFEVGAVDYVTKPIQHEEVLARVTTHLRAQDLTRQLQAANAELAKQNVSKDRFFSILAHDLRGPFLPLLGLTEMLANVAGEMPVAQLQEVAQGIHRSASRIYNLLENLLTWSRLQSGKVDVEQNSVSLDAAVSTTFELLAETAAAKQIELQNDIPKTSVVYADEKMVSTVIRNLVSNALKFTEPGGNVTVSAHEESLELPNGSSKEASASKFVEVHVTDTGVGISEDALDKLFNVDTSHTTLGTAEERGTGLGLSICKDMVEMNGGQIWIESTVGQGTTVKFTLLRGDPLPEIETEAPTQEEPVTSIH